MSILYCLEPYLTRCRRLAYVSQLRQKADAACTIRLGTFCGRDAPSIFMALFQQLEEELKNRAAEILHQPLNKP